jgi:hypothetical protein
VLFQRIDGTSLETPETHRRTCDYSRGGDFLARASEVGFAKLAHRRLKGDQRLATADPPLPTMSVGFAGGESGKLFHARPGVWIPKKS